VRIRRLALCPYRNFEALELPLGDGHVLITGANGRGKSNILEAISYLSIGKSIRGARDREVVPHEGSHFDIRAQWFDGERERQLRVFYGAEVGKRAFVDEAPLERMSDVVSLFQRCSSHRKTWPWCCNSALSGDGCSTSCCRRPTRPICGRCSAISAC